MAIREALPGAELGALPTPLTTPDTALSLMHVHAHVHTHILVFLSLQGLSQPSFQTQVPTLSRNHPLTLLKVRMKQEERPVYTSGGLNQVQRTPPPPQPTPPILIAGEPPNDDANIDRVALRTVPAGRTSGTPDSQLIPFFLCAEQESTLCARSCPRPPPLRHFCLSSFFQSSH